MMPKHADEYGDEHADERGNEHTDEHAERTNL